MNWIFSKFVIVRCSTGNPYPYSFEVLKGQGFQDKAPCKIFCKHYAQIKEDHGI